MDVGLKFLQLENQRNVWFQLCVKNNNGFFYTGPQKEHLLESLDDAGEGPDSAILRERFPSATWYVKYPWSPRGVNKTFLLMLIGDNIGVLGKLKVANKSERDAALANGFVVTWERPVGLAMNDQARALVKDALSHMTRAEKMLASSRSRESALRKHLLTMVRWKRRVEYLKGGSGKIVMDADVSEMMEHFTDKMIQRVIMLHNAKFDAEPLLPQVTYDGLLLWIDRSIDRHMEREVAEE